MSRLIGEISFDAVVSIEFSQVAARAQSHHRCTRAVIFELKPAERVTRRAQILRANVRNAMRSSNNLDLARKVRSSRLGHRRQRADKEKGSRNDCEPDLCHAWHVTNLGVSHTLAHPGSSPFD